MFATNYSLFRRNCTLCSLFKNVDFAWLQIAIMCRFWRICETTKLFHSIFCLLEDFFSFSPSTNKMIYDILGRILRIQSQTTFESSIRIMNWTFDFYWMKVSNHHSHNSTLFSIPKILYFRKFINSWNLFFKSIRLW